MMAPVPGTSPQILSLTNLSVFLPDLPLKDPFTIAVMLTKGTYLEQMDSFLFAYFVKRVISVASY